MYTYELYDSIVEVNPDEWDRLHRPEGDPFMDRRFILAVERSTAERRKFWHLVVRDENQRPVAIACLSLLTVDLASLAEGRAGKTVRRSNRVFPRLLRFRLLCCGLPAISEQSHLRLAAGADSSAVVRIVDQVIREIAARQRANCVGFAFFDGDERERLAALAELGYVQVDADPINHVSAAYCNFDDYLASLTCKKRRHVKHSQRKFQQSGLRVVQLSGRDGVDGIFTDEVYRLYEAVYDRAAHKLEKLPAGFFLELARQVPDGTLFTFIYDVDRVVAFSVSLFTESVHYAMFCGYDYELNPHCDLYFNLMFHTVDCGLRQDVSEIVVGSTSDTFKRRRLSAHQHPQYAFIKGTRPIASYLVRSRYRESVLPRDEQARKSSAEQEGIMFHAKQRKNGRCYRPESRVLVRSEHDIRATLDSEGKLEGLPFMPEMIKYCGRTFQIHRRADAVFLDDYYYSASMKDVVLLADVRCDGTSHEGCQLDCLIFWKEAWLEPVDTAEATRPIDGNQPTSEEVQLTTRKNGKFCCQATELVEATSRLPWWRLGHYARALRSREVTLRQLARVGLFLARGRLRKRRGPPRGPQKTKLPEHRLDLQPGEWVEVKRRAEIEVTLDVDGKHRGMVFTPEMAECCGKRYRVLRRVEKIIVEWTGKPRNIRDTVALEDVTCRGLIAKMCPRKCYHLWRESWLKKVE